MHNERSKMGDEHFQVMAATDKEQENFGLRP